MSTPTDDDTVTPLLQPVPDELYLALAKGLTAGAIRGALTCIPDNYSLDYIRLDGGCFTLVLKSPPNSK